VGDTSGGSGGGTPTEPVIPDATSPVDASPWAGMPQTILMLITASILLSAIASYLVSIGNTPYTFPLKVLGWILAGVAMALALAAMYMGYQLISQHGQWGLGMLYIAGGGCAAVAAGLAFAGNAANNSMQLAFSAMAGVSVLIGSMLGAG
jgi:hypothetical protein